MSNSSLYHVINNHVDFIGLTSITLASDIGAFALILVVVIIINEH